MFIREIHKKLTVRYSFKNSNMRFTTWATKVKLTNRRWWINSNYSLVFKKKTHCGVYEEINQDFKIMGIDGTWWKITSVSHNFTEKWI